MPGDFIRIGSMYGIFTYIYHKNQPNVGKYTSPMDANGIETMVVFSTNHLSTRVAGFFNLPKVMGFTTKIYAAATPDDFIGCFFDDSCMICLIPSLIEIPIFC